MPFHSEVETKRWTPKGGGRLPARHVFVRGALKCGIGMEAMLPRTERKRGKLYETYQCRTNKTMGVAACSMPILLRSAVEIAAVDMFAKTAFDFATTREHVAGQLSTRVAEVVAQAARAEREAADLQGQADRVERDYRRGALPAEDYARMRADIAAELTATAAERTRLLAHADELRAAEVNLDAEDVTLRALAELRQAIAGQISNTEGIGALRAAMAQVFEFVSMMPTAYLNGLNDEGELPELPDPLTPGHVAVVPAVREEMVAGTPRPWPEDVGPLRRVGLALGADNYPQGTLLWKYMTQNTFRLS